MNGPIEDDSIQSSMADLAWNSRTFRSYTASESEVMALTKLLFSPDARIHQNPIALHSRG